MMEEKLSSVQTHLNSKVDKLITRTNQMEKITIPEIQDVVVKESRDLISSIKLKHDSLEHEIQQSQSRRDELAADLRRELETTSHSLNLSISGCRDAIADNRGNIANIQQADRTSNLSALRLAEDKITQVATQVTRMENQLRTVESGLREVENGVKDNRSDIKDTAAAADMSEKKLTDALQSLQSNCTFHASSAKVVLSEYKVKMNEDVDSRVKAVYNELCEKLEVLADKAANSERKMTENVNSTIADINDKISRLDKYQQDGDDRIRDELKKSTVGQEHVAALEASITMMAKDLSNMVSELHRENEDNIKKVEGSLTDAEIERKADLQRHTQSLNEKYDRELQEIRNMISSTGDRIESPSHWIQAHGKELLKLTPLVSRIDDDVKKNQEKIQSRWVETQDAMEQFKSACMDSILQYHQDMGLQVKAVEEGMQADLRNTMNTTKSLDNKLSKIDTVIEDKVHGEMANLIMDVEKLKAESHAIDTSVHDNRKLINENRQSALDIIDKKVSTTEDRLENEMSKWREEWWNSFSGLKDAYLQDKDDTNRKLESIVTWKNSSAALASPQVIAELEQRLRSMEVSSGEKERQILDSVDRYWKKVETVDAELSDMRKAQNRSGESVRDIENKLLRLDGNYQIFVENRDSQNRNMEVSYKDALTKVEDSVSQLQSSIEHVRREYQDALKTVEGGALDHVRELLVGHSENIEARLAASEERTGVIVKMSEDSLKNKISNVDEKLRLEADRAATTAITIENKLQSHTENVNDMIASLVDSKLANHDQLIRGHVERTYLAADQIDSRIQAKTDHKAEEVWGRCTQALQTRTKDEESDRTLLVASYNDLRAYVDRVQERVNEKQSSQGFQTEINALKTTVSDLSDHVESLNRHRDMAVESESRERDVKMMHEDLDRVSKRLEAAEMFHKQAREELNHFSKVDVAYDKTQDKLNNLVSQLEDANLRLAKSERDLKTMKSAVDRVETLEQGLRDSRKVADSSRTRMEDVEGTINTQLADFRDEIQAVSDACNGDVREVKNACRSLEMKMSRVDSAVDEKVHAEASKINVEMDKLKASLSAAEHALHDTRRIAVDTKQLTLETIDKKVAATEDKMEGDMSRWREEWWNSFSDLKGTFVQDRDDMVKRVNNIDESCRQFRTHFEGRAQDDIQQCKTSVAAVETHVTERLRSIEETIEGSAATMSSKLSAFIERLMTDYKQSRDSDGQKIQGLVADAESRYATLSRDVRDCSQLVSTNATKINDLEHQTSGIHALHTQVSHLNHVFKRLEDDMEDKTERQGRRNDAVDAEISDIRRNTNRCTEAMRDFETKVMKIDSNYHTYIENSEGNKRSLETAFKESWKKLEESLAEVSSRIDALRREYHEAIKSSESSTMSHVRDRLDEQASDVDSRFQSITDKAGMLAKLTEDSVRAKVLNLEDKLRAETENLVSAVRNVEANLQKDRSALTESVSSSDIQKLYEYLEKMETKFAEKFHNINQSGARDRSVLSDLSIDVESKFSGLQVSLRQVMHDENSKIATKLSSVLDQVDKIDALQNFIQKDCDTKIETVRRDVMREVKEEMKTIVNEDRENQVQASEMVLSAARSERSEVDIKMSQLKSMLEAKVEEMVDEIHRFEETQTQGMRVVQDDLLVVKNWSEQTIATIQSGLQDDRKALEDMFDNFSEKSRGRFTELANEVHDLRSAVNEEKSHATEMSKQAKSAMTDVDAKVKNVGNQINDKFSELRTDLYRNVARSITKAMQGARNPRHLTEDDDSNVMDVSITQFVHSLHNDLDKFRQALKTQKGDYVVKHEMAEALHNWKAEIEDANSSNLAQMIQTNKDSIASLAKNDERVWKDLGRLNEDIDGFVGDLRDVKKQLQDEHSSRIDSFLSLKSSGDTLSTDLHSLYNKMAGLPEGVANMKKNLNILMEGVHETKKRLNHVEGNVASVTSDTEDKLQYIKKMMDSSFNDLSSRQSSIQQADLQSSIKSVERQNTERFLSALSELEHKVDNEVLKLSASHGDNERMLHQLDTKVKKCDQRLESSVQQLARVSDNVDQMTGELRKLDDRVTSFSNAATKDMTAKRELNEMSDNVREQLDKETSRIHNRVNQLADTCVQLQTQMHQHVSQAQGVDSRQLKELEKSIQVLAQSTGTGASEAQLAQIRDMHTRQDAQEAFVRNVLDLSLSIANVQEALVAKVDKLIAQGETSFNSNISDQTKMATKDTLNQLQMLKNVSDHQQTH
eukprot:GFYU01002814.1.p1 GENE.GFYU01002814.1~~GFYU01002814.1.p1  ORF type:complete len:2320 (+),score=829.92 GFYU01002814.1:296-6961(+)